MNSKSMGNKKKIWLIRHSESESNAGERTSEPATILLSQKGLAQSEELIFSFKEKPSLIVTSRYVRTKHTALPIIKKFTDVRHEEWDVHEFTYLSPGKCRNMTSAERAPMVNRYWDLNDPSYCDGPGAESFDDFIKRVRRTLETLKKRDESFIAIFSHGEFITGLMWIMKDSMLNLSDKRMQEYRRFLSSLAPQNAQIIEIVM